MTLLKSSENIEDVFPLSDIQMGMLYESLIPGTASVYYNQVAFPFKDQDFNFVRFKKAISLLVEKHPILRTGFNIYEEEKPVQIVYKKIPLNVVLYDISHLTPGEQENRINSCLQEERRCFFYITDAEPLWRIRIFRLDHQNIYFIWINHHAIHDGWSFASLMTEFNNTYLSLKSDHGFMLKKLKSTYKDFIIEQIIYKKNANVTEFWKNELSDYKRFDIPGVSNELIPGEQNKKKVISKNFGFQYKEILNKVAKMYNTSLRNLCFAAYVYSLYMLSYENEFVIGLVSHNRPECEDGDKIIGCFLNEVPVRIRIPENLKWMDFIHLIERKLRMLSNYNKLSLFEIVKIIGEKAQGKNPIFDIIFNYTDFHIYRQLDNTLIQTNGTNNRHLPSIQASNLIETNAFLDFNVDTSEGLFLNIAFSDSIIPEEIGEKICSFFINVINYFIKEPESPAVKDKILFLDEKKKLLYEFNNTQTYFPQDQTVHRLVEDQTEKTPDHIALQFIEEQLTYNELNHKANSLATVLRAKGVKPNSIVRLMVERSLEMIVGVLGILKSAGAYLPIDPDYPGGRIKHMLEGHGQCLILTAHCPMLATQGNFDMIDLTDKRLYQEGCPNPENLNTSRDLAYLIYTSGSTGIPKGVMIEHRSVVNFIKGITDKIAFSPGKIILALTTLCFDISVLETVLPLTKGLRVVIVDKYQQKDSMLLSDVLLKNKVAMLQTTPAGMHLLLSGEGGLSYFRTLKEIMIGGEAFPAKLLEDLHQLTDVKVYNMYGPTETTIWSTVQELTHARKVDIGKPISNTQIYILDKNKNLQPIGVLGELCIAGVGLARGYLGDEVLNAKKFDTTPFNGNQLMYRTGDLARWLPDGNIECFGRVDDQVKIRGFRIELGEIESQLLKHDKIEKTVVVVRGHESADKHLCAYIVPRQSLDTEDFPTAMQLREYLAGELPGYMIPSYFVTIVDIPVTPNGKVDRKRLPDPEFKAGMDYIAPRNKVEKKLTEIWADILEIDKRIIGVGSNFFELGGHSLKAIVLISKIHRELDVKISLMELFKTLTLAKLAEFVKKSVKDRHVIIEPVEKKDYYILSSAQKRLYILHQLDLQNTAYNMPAAIPIQIANLEKFDESIKKLIWRHESLRTSFHIVNEEPVQKIHHPDEVEFQIKQLKSAAQFVHPFDLSLVPLLRVGFVNMGGTGNLLLVDMHHIITDGLSEEILARDFMTFYQGEDLPPPRIQYKDFAQWQNLEEQKETLSNQETYWLKEFEDEIPVLNLPADYPRPAVQDFEGDDLFLELESQETAKLKELALKQSATLYMVLLSIFNVLLSKLSSQEDIVIGTPIAGRRHADLERIIGMFVNTLALRNYPSGEKNFKAFLKEVKKRTLSAFENQEHQFEDLVEKARVTRDAGRNPLFDVMFSLQNMGDIGETTAPSAVSQVEGDPLGEYSEYFLEGRTAKFDLTLTAVEIDSKVSFVFNYSTRLFKTGTIERFIKFFSKIIHSIAQEPGMRISGIDILSEKEKGQLLFDFNDTTANYPTDKTIYQLFREQVEKKNHRVALVCQEKDRKERKDEHHLTYWALNKKSNRLACRLRERSIVRNDIVAIMTEPALEMMMGIFGILKIGACYLPIDPENPGGRVSYILDDSEARLLLTQKHLLEPTAVEFEGETLNIRDEDEDLHKETSGGTMETGECGGAHDSVYMIYTSGTTGTPKGTLVKHENLVNYVNWFSLEAHLTGQDKTPLTSSFAFDLGYTCIYPSLLNGGQLHILPKEMYMHPGSLLEYIRTRAISYVKMTPSLFTTLVNDPDFLVETLKSLRLVVLGGEAINAADVEKVYRVCPHLRVMNEYGPTEVTIGCIAQFIEIEELEAYKARPTIGKPIYNTKAYILDKYSNILPVGIAGELYISGAQVARGYFKKEALTAEKFIELKEIAGGKIYRTGDLARWLPDGRIEFLGRIDTQVKIRGYRVELGEIENQLQAYEAVKDAVVLALTGASGNKYLCAYIVFADGSDLGAASPSAFKEYLSHSLPAYMVPCHFVTLDKLPLTPNGKLDRKSMPQPEISISGDLVAPHDHIEKEMVAIWKEVLGIEERQLGINANFFELGGNSLNAVIMLSKCHQAFNVRIPLAEVFKTPTIMGLSAFTRGAAEEGFAPLKIAEKKDYHDLSSAQLRMYILSRVDLESTAYNMPSLIPLNEKPEVKRLEGTFIQLIQRHESFRTSFHMLSGTPVQEIHDQVEFRIDDYQPGGSPGHGVDEIIKKFVQPFDLEKAPLLRVTLTGTETRGYLLMIDMHHIISDGVSRMILRRDFRALSRGEAESLPPLMIQYKDFAEWQNSEKENEYIKCQETYWLKEFAGEIPVLNLPTDYTRPAVQIFEGDIVNFEISVEQTSALKSVALSEGATLFMILLAVYNVLLSKLCSQEDVVIGVPIAGRRHADLENTMGMFVNTLTLRNYPAAEKTFAKFLAEVKERTLAALENQDYQFEELVEKVMVDRNAGRNPLFDVTFLLNNINIGTSSISGEKQEMPEEERPAYNFENRIAKFDLTLFAVEADEKMLFSFQYCTKLFKKETMVRFINYFQKIVRLILQEPGIKISGISIISEKEKEQLLCDFNHTQANYPKDKTIHQLFEEQMEKTPDHITMVNWESGIVSFCELNKRSNQLAHLLKAKGIGSGSIVAIMTEPSTWMIKGIMAVLKSGACYLPIDPENPRGRITFMLDDSESQLVLTPKKFVRQVAVDFSDEILNMEDEHPNQYEDEKNVQDENNGSGDIVYMIYTSGTTGTPKGVQVKHENLVNYVNWFTLEAHITGQDKTPLTSSFAFDLGYTSIYPSLLNGGQLHILPKEMYMLPGKLLEYIRTQGISYVKMTPSLFTTLVNDPDFLVETWKSLRLVVLGGEAINASDVEKAYRVCPHLRVMNHYGPTEVTIGCIAQFIDIEELEAYKVRPTIGKPIYNTKAYILDKYSNILPVGIHGELCLSGAQVARGYFKKEALTAEKFIELKEIAEGKIYRTGDLARWLPDGRIEFLGRIDHQVKIRGYRIEPGEIENQLLGLEEIKEAVVLANTNQAGIKYLCAYIVPRDTGTFDKTTSEIRDYLSRSLPDYMIPTYIIQLDKVPLTSNGKVDRKALPEPTAAPGSEYAAPCDKIEEKLVDIWSQILDTGGTGGKGNRQQAVGINDDFFQLGGQSLTAIIMLSRLHKQLNVKVPLAEVFKSPNIKGLARYIRGVARNRFASIKPMEKKEYYPLSSAQKRLYILEQMAPGTTVYNMPRTIPLQAPVDKEKIADTFKKLIARHESLRTSFHMVKHEPVQTVHDTVEFDIQHNGEDFIRSFDLSRAPLLRASLSETGETGYLLMVDMQHIVSDGFSRTILERDFMALYADQTLPRLGIQYKDFSQWENEEKQKENLKYQQAYWLKEFQGDIPVLNLPTDYPRPEVQGFEGSSIGFEIKTLDPRLIKNCAREHGVTVFMLMLAVINILFARLSNQEDIIIGTPTAGRSHTDLELIIGMFVNTLALRNYPAKEKTFKEFLSEVKKRTLEAFDNQGYQFEDLVEKLGLKRDRHNPLFDVMFACTDRFIDRIDSTDDTDRTRPAAPAAESQPEKNANGTAKFDLYINITVSRTLRFFSEYSTQLFQQETIESFARIFSEILSHVLVDSNVKIQDIDVTTTLADTELKEVQEELAGMEF